MKHISAILLLLFSQASFADNYWKVGDVFPLPLLGCVDAGDVLELFESDKSQIKANRSTLIKNQKCAFLQGYQFTQIQKWNVTDGYQRYLVTVQFLSLDLYGIIAGEPVDEI